MNVLKNVLNGKRKCIRKVFFQSDDASSNEIHYLFMDENTEYD